MVYKPQKFVSWVAESGMSKIKALAALVSGNGPNSGSKTGLLTVSSHGREKARELFGAVFVRAPI